MVLFLSIALFFPGLYVLLILILTAGAGRLKREDTTGISKAGSVSLIIPFRDEAHRIRELVRDLEQQSFDGDHFEVIFVNDHSQDGSRDLLDHLIRTNPRFRCMDLPENRSGKKEALSHAVQHARGEWIIQTDADCRLGPNFIASHMAFLEARPSDLVAGLVTTHKGQGGFLETFERMDLLSLTGAGAGSFYYGRPLMCSGSNLLYSRKLFMDTLPNHVAGEVASGDDMFLMIGARKLGRTLSFNVSRESMVRTAPVKRWTDLIAQRMRWGSKTVHYRMPCIQLFALLVALSNLLILIFPILILIHPGFWPWFTGMITVKTMADYSLLHRITGHTGQRRTLRAFIPGVLFYYPYQLVVLAGSLFSRKEWKGRRI